MERTHGVDKQEAIRRIDGYLDELVQRQWPMGIKVKEADKKWTGDRLDFSVKGKKGLMGATLHGSIEVGENDALLKMDLPGVVTSLVGEDRIRGAIGRRFDALFEKKA